MSDSKMLEMKSLVICLDFQGKGQTNTNKACPFQKERAVCKHIPQILTRCTCLFGDNLLYI